MVTAAKAYGTDCAWVVACELVTRAPRQVPASGTLTVWQVWEDRPCPSCEIGGWEVAAVFLDRGKALEYAAGRPNMSVGPLQVRM